MFRFLETSLFVLRIPPNSATDDWLKTVPYRCDSNVVLQRTRTAVLDCSICRRRFHLLQLYVCFVTVLTSYTLG